MEYDIFIPGMSYEMRDKYAREIGHAILNVAIDIAKRENPAEHRITVSPQHVHTAMTELVTMVIE